MANGTSRRLVCGAALSLALLAAGCGFGAGTSPSKPAPAPSGQTTPAPGTAGTGTTGGAAGTGSTGTTGGAAGAGTTGAFSNATLASHYTANGTASVQAGQALKVEMTEFKFTPNTITASVGKPVSIALANKGTVTHNLSLPAFKVNVTLPPGHATTVKFTPDKAGTYYFYCDVPGHVQAGMVGKLTVK